MVLLLLLRYYYVPSFTISGISLLPQTTKRATSLPSIVKEKLCWCLVKIGTFLSPIPTGGSSSSEGWLSPPTSSPFCSILTLFMAQAYAFNLAFSSLALSMNDGAERAWGFCCKEAPVKTVFCKRKKNLLVGRPFRSLRSIFIHRWQRMYVAFKALMMVLQMVVQHFDFFIPILTGWKKWGGARAFVWAPKIACWCLSWQCWLCQQAKHELFLLHSPLEESQTRLILSAST